MKNIDLTYQGGYPLVQESLAFMQDSYLSGIFALAKSFAELRPNQAIILTGCVLTVSATILSISEGYVIWNDGEIRRVKATSLPYVLGAALYLNPTQSSDPILDPTYYALTSQVQDVHLENYAIISYTPSANALPLIEDNRLQNILLTQSSDPWHSVGAIAEPPLAPGISAITVLQFKKTNFGEVILRGYADFGTNTNQPVLFTLPPAYRPSTDVLLPFAGQAFFTSFYLESQLIVRTNGDVQSLSVPSAANSTLKYASLDSIRFFI